MFKNLIRHMNTGRKHLIYISDQTAVGKYRIMTEYYPSGNKKEECVVHNGNIVEHNTFYDCKIDSINSIWVVNKNKWAYVDKYDSDGEHTMGYPYWENLIKDKNHPDYNDNPRNKDDSDF